MDNLWSKPAYRAAIYLAGVVFAGWLFYSARTVLFPFCAAFIIAYMLDPVIDRMEEFKVNRSLAILFLFSIIAAIFFAIISIIGPMVIEQIDTLARNLPHYLDRLEKAMEPVFAMIPAMDPEEINSRLRESMGQIGDLALKLVKAVSSGIWSGIAGAMGFLVAMVNLILIPVASFYLLKDFDVITAKLSERIPPAYKGRTLEIVGKIDATLGAFIRGQLTVALFMATILSIGLTLIEVPMGLLIGMIAGLANIVPYLSVVVGLLPAVALAYLNFWDFAHPLMVIALFSGAQLFEGFILTPRVLEKAVGLHPVLVMAALLAGGTFFGFIGILVAVPVAAILKVALLEMDEAYLNSSFFKDNTGGATNKSEK